MVSYPVYVLKWALWRLHGKDKRKRLSRLGGTTRSKCIYEGAFVDVSCSIVDYSSDEALPQDNDCDDEDFNMDTGYNIPGVKFHKQHMILIVFVKNTLESLSSDNITSRLENPSKGNLT